MTTELATPKAPPRWRRALDAVVRALSAPTETDAFSAREEDTVFQPRAAAARTARRRPRHSADA